MYGHYHGNDQTSVKGQVEASAVGLIEHTVETKKLHLSEGKCVYSGTQRKPQFLLYLENYVDKELHAINPNEPKFQELKLQVYRDTFYFFIKEFKTYQPLLSAIKKEYENTLAYQQYQIREMEALRSHLRHVTEECNRKIQARWREEQAEIGALKRENQKLQETIETQTSKQGIMQAVVDHLQSELSNQYLQYREECDARKLLLWQLNDLTRCSVKEGQFEDENSRESKDPVELQLALKVCRQDLTTAQEEFTRIKAEYWDVVPRRDWDALKQTHNQTLQQLMTLQGDFDLLKMEFDTLLEIYKKGSLENETQQYVTGQVEKTVLQIENQSQDRKLQEPINSHEDDTLTVQQFRKALKTSFPLKSDEEIDKLVASAQGEPDYTADCISSQKLYTLLEDSGVETLPQGFPESGGGENTDTINQKNDEYS